MGSAGIRSEKPDRSFASGTRADRSTRREPSHSMARLSCGGTSSILPSRRSVGRGSQASLPTHDTIRNPANQAQTRHSGLRLGYMRANRYSRATVLPINVQLSGWTQDIAQVLPMCNGSKARKSGGRPLKPVQKITLNLCRWRHTIPELHDRAGSGFCSRYLNPDGFRATDSNLRC